MRARFRHGALSLNSDGNRFTLGDAGVLARGSTQNSPPLSAMAYDTHK